MQIHNFVFTVSILQCLVGIAILDEANDINKKDRKSESISNDKDFQFPELPMINSRTSFNVNTGNSKYMSGPYEHSVTAQSGIDLGE